ncbi:hypothetical protein THRCLA_07260 [Thraustotheca clavata]|uniref:ABC transporter domain-containing protein n=1 Tax=Thraustotheca clavata TaxID=74557 RepID=A0A1V9ZEU4_9STRA|nr:hypothetical protein THRCLA_07260 [Thraustotheca clavata]
MEFISWEICIHDVSKDDREFYRSIANSIRHGKPGASLKEVYAAAKQANAYDFIMGFPGKLNTELGDHGAQLSGDEKQRIAIVRAIIKNPSILILDEATSGLDTERQHIVQASLDHLASLYMCIETYRCAMQQRRTESNCLFGVSMAVQHISDRSKAKKAVERVFDIIDRVPSIDCSATTGTVLSTFRGDIEFREVAFAYPLQPGSKIYKTYSLIIHAGQTLALVGDSGSGKSTAINLIERLYDPTSGTIFLGGHDFRTLNNPCCTIAENIATGKPGATQAETEAAAKKTNAHDFIMRFPNGYNTFVGDRGAQLSGGKKQRIAIARAFVSDAKVLLLDEVTSMLDGESERIVMESLDALLKQKRRTALIVPHRLSTIRNAEMIAVA